MVSTHMELIVEHRSQSTEPLIMMCLLIALLERFRPSEYYCTFPKHESHSKLQRKLSGCKMGTKMDIFIIHFLECSILQLMVLGHKHHLNHQPLFISGKKLVCRYSSHLRSHERKKITQI